MSPRKPLHDELLTNVADWSYRSIEHTRARIRVQCALGIPTLESEPEPDVVWAKRAAYARQHPRPDDVLLIIEVAESSLSKDTTTKAELYAEAGIADYWVVDVVGQVIEVFRDPDPQRKRYRTKNTFAGDERLSPLCQPEVELQPRVLWAS